MTAVPWIRLYTSWPRHRKTMKLRGLLGTGEPILCLWCWAAENAPDGDLGTMTPQEIEYAAEWRGEPGKCFDALLASGYLDVSANGHTLHEWQDGSGAGIAAYRKRTERQREIMRQRRSGSGVEKEEEVEVDRSANVGANVSANEKLTRPRKRRGPTDGFEVFYAAYPRKKARGNAEKAWPGDHLLQKIMAGLEAQLPGMRKQMAIDPGKVKHPASWLNAKCWEDEPDRQPSLLSRPKPAPLPKYEPKGDYAAEAAADPDRARKEAADDAEARRKLEELKRTLAEGMTT